MTSQTPNYLAISIGDLERDGHKEGEARFPAPNAVDICRMSRDSFVDYNQTFGKPGGSRDSHIEVVNGHIHLVFDGS